jgi:LmbE family N-acetylglucosaminyl deacetylase
MLGRAYAAPRVPADACEHGCVLADEDVERALVVVAHPDDVDFGSAGTVARWTDAGIKVTYCVVTDGDAGGFDPAVARAEIAGIRQAEQRAAAAEVGVTDLRFLGYPDGRVEVTLELRRDIARVIREVRPQRVITGWPVRTFLRIGIAHPDHRAVGEAALCAVYPDARNPFAHPELAAEGLAAWTVSEVWLVGSDQPNQFVDITDVFDRKMTALLQHVSQHPDLDGLRGRMLEWGNAIASAGGLPAGRLAEAYYVMPTE